MKIVNNLGYLCLLVSLSLQAGDAKHTQIPHSLPVSITPETNSFYVGMGVGKFRLEDSDTDEVMTAATVTLIVGYEMNRYLSTELRYTRSLEDLSYEGATTKDLDMTFTNLALYVKLGYEVYDFTSYVLLGYGESKISDFVGADRKEAGFQYGAGIAYSIDEKWSLFVDYTKAYDDKGFDGRSQQDDLNIGLWNFGVAYHF